MAAVSREEVDAWRAAEEAASTAAALKQRAAIMAAQAARADDPSAPTLKEFLVQQRTPPEPEQAEPEKVWAQDRHGKPGWQDPNAEPFNIMTADVDALTVEEIVLRSKAKEQGYWLEPAVAEGVSQAEFPPEEVETRTPAEVAREELDALVAKRGKGHADFQRIAQLRGQL